MGPLDVYGESQVLFFAQNQADLDFTKPARSTYLTGPVNPDLVELKLHKTSA